jgi:predicted transcriptional regulator
MGLNWQPIFESTGYLHAKNYPNEAGYRNDSCSKEAASKINPTLRERQKAVLTYLAAQETGATVDDAAKALNKHRDALKPRFTELKLLGLIRKSGRKSTTELGGTCHIWEAVV